MTTEKSNLQNTASDTSKPKIISDEELRALGLTPPLEPIEGNDTPCYLTDEDREKFGSAGELPTFIRKSPQDTEYGNKS